MTGLIQLSAVLNAAGIHHTRDSRQGAGPTLLLVADAALAGIPACAPLAHRMEDGGDVARTLGRTLGMLGVDCRLAELHIDGQPVVRVTLAGDADAAQLAHLLAPLLRPQAKAERAKAALHAAVSACPRPRGAGSELANDAAWYLADALCELHNCLLDKPVLPPPEAIPDENGHIDLGIIEPLFAHRLYTLLRGDACSLGACQHETLSTPEEIAANPALAAREQDALSHAMAEVFAELAGAEVPRPCRHTRRASQVALGTWTVPESLKLLAALTPAVTTIRSTAAVMEKL